MWNIIWSCDIKYAKIINWIYIRLKLICQYKTKTTLQQDGKLKNVRLRQQKKKTN